MNTPKIYIPYGTSDRDIWQYLVNQAADVEWAQTPSDVQIMNHARDMEEIGKNYKLKKIKEI